MIRSFRAVTLSGVVLLAVASSIAGLGCSGADDDDGGTPTPACTPLPNNNFSTLQSAIFGLQCGLASCHGTAMSGGLVLNSGAAHSYTEMVGVLSSGTFMGVRELLVDPGNADGSYLFHKLTLQGQDDQDPPTSPMSGNQMPSTGQYLCGEKLTAVEAWINAGAPNN